MKKLMALLVLLGLGLSCSRVDDEDIQREEEYDRTDMHERDSYKKTPFQDDVDLDQGMRHENSLDRVN